VNAPRPTPAPVPTHAEPRGTPFRGISLKPKDAIDPYQYDRFAPDTIGIQQMGTWCKHCQGSLLVTDMFMAEDALYIYGVCFTCGDPATGRPGLCKRFRLPLPWRPPPPLSGD
jgi:hypothetical protein